MAFKVIRPFAVISLRSVAVSLAAGDRERRGLATIGLRAGAMKGDGR